jgi:Undecaprenyl-phosphate glucose phosphotransferase
MSESIAPETDAMQDAARVGALPAADVPARRARGQISSDVIRGFAQLTDVAVIMLSGVVAIEAYTTSLLGTIREPDRYWLAIVLAALIFPFVHRKGGGYTTQRLSELTWQVGRMVLTLAATGSILTTLAFLAKVAPYYSRGWATLFGTLSFAALASVRMGASLLIQRWTRAGRLSRIVAVVGAGPLGQQVVARLRAAKDSRVSVLGVFDDRMTRVPTEIAGCHVLGTTDDLISQVRQSLIDEVILALPLRAETRIGELVAKLRSLPVDLRLSLDPASGVFPMRGMSEIASMQMIEILDRPLKHWSGFVKSMEDRVLSALLLALMAPVMGMIALAIRLDSRGPALFVQERFGFNNDTIRVFKFRTMRSEEADPSGAVRTTPDDSRVTRVGRILRRLSLDELPQLFNVFAGDMSLVGPRPHVKEMKAGERLYHEAVGDYFHRHRVRPGMTGWAQVHGLRGEIDTPEKAQARVAYDLWYIDHWSIWLDIKILLMTARVIVSGENAY